MLTGLGAIGLMFAGGSALAIAVVNGANGSMSSDGAIALSLSGVIGIILGAIMWKTNE